MGAFRPGAGGEGGGGVTLTVDIASLRLHPDAERVPESSREDRERLRDSLAENGQQDPIDITHDRQILDGRTRWQVLQAEGATTIRARVIEVPETQQTSYIVDRALARRHLTADQKRTLNELLREVVVEVVTHPTTGEEVRIGHGQTQRARTLGLDTATVVRWDQEQAATANAVAATHHRVANRIEPIHKPRQTAPVKPRTAAQVNRGQMPVTPGRRHPPRWMPEFTKWCKYSTRPEDRDLLLRFDAQIHAALAQNDLSCQHTEKES